MIIFGLILLVSLKFASATLNLPTEVTFDSAIAGSAVKKVFLIQNPNESVSEISLSHNVGNIYEIKFYDGSSLISNFNLTVGGTKNITVKGIIPASLKVGKSMIGKVIFGYGNVTQTIPLNVQVKSTLAISKVELNGKTDGKFKMGKSNKVEVTVKNLGNVTVEDVEIKATIKDIDSGDDLDEESNEFDLNVGASEEESLKFKIDSDLDEEDYEVDIEIFVKNDKVLETSRTYEVDRKKHDLKIKSVTFPSLVSCNRYPNLYAKVENLGEKDEDEVVIKLSNSVLGFNYKKSNIELDDYSGDNSYQANFPLDLTSTKKGSYQFLLEVYREETRLEDSKIISFQVKDCVNVGTKTSPAFSQNEIIKKLQATPPQVIASATKVTNAPQDNAYLILLVVLVGLLFIATILVILVLIKK